MDYSSDTTKAAELTSPLLTKHIKTLSIYWKNNTKCLKSKVSINFTFLNMDKIRNMQAL